MLEVHVRSTAALDLLEGKLHPQKLSGFIFFNDSKGRMIELFSHEMRSLPTMSEMEAEGAAAYLGLAPTMTHEAFERFLLEWAIRELLFTRNRSDLKLAYPIQEGSRLEIAG